MRERRRGRKIAMTPDEIDAFLSSQRVCRSPPSARKTARTSRRCRSFGWLGFSLYSIVKSQRWTDFQRRPQLAIVIDAGTESSNCRRGDHGTAEVVGEIPRMSSPDDELARPELLFARKYFGSDTLFPDGDTPGCSDAGEAARVRTSGSSIRHQRTVETRDRRDPTDTAPKATMSNSSSSVFIASTNMNVGFNALMGLDLMEFEPDGGPHRCTSTPPGRRHQHVHGASLLRHRCDDASRGGGIRTHDLFVPNADSMYQDWSASAIELHRCDRQ